jgi:hypothetical protein
MVLVIHREPLVQRDLRQTPTLLLLGTTLALGALCGCQPGASDAEPTPALSEPSTEELLDAFYTDHGGRRAFPPHLVDALEALLYGQDDLEAGDRAGARARVDQIFDAMPLYAPIWRQEVSFDGINIGDPVAYYGLRMLDHILELYDGPSVGRLQMTAVVAPCAEVTRPTLPDLDPETVSLEVAPQILADDARVLRSSTDLFRHWVRAITEGLEVELVVHTMPECTTVDYSDDGAIVVSYPDAAGMVDSVPAAIASSTDFWWVVAPSGVPGDGSGFGRHFITGGMGVYGLGLPLFLSDDAWFTRKPEHLGVGPYSEVELRAYQPQWFQHEFMHHLFRTWPEFGLEDEGHQWFDRSTWPPDFEGVFEPDYYAEAITRRLLSATPSLAEGLSAPEFVDLSIADPAVLAGNYRRLPVLNDWHEVSVTNNGGALRWNNAAGVSWGLEIRDGGLWTESDCPYGISELDVEGTEAAVTALWFGGERYGRIP